MIGLVLLWVGAVLALNGLWLMGYIQNREISVINIFSGGLILVVSVITALTSEGEIPDIRFGAFALLFAFTYLWVAIDRFFNVNGAGLGWYSLFVAITAAPVAIETLAGADGDVWLTWFGLNWAGWAVLWFLYFLLLVPQTIGNRLAGIVTLVLGILTGWLPGYLVLQEHLAI